MKKNILKVVTLFVSLFALFGLADHAQVQAEGEKLNVVTTTTWLTDLTEQIGGDRIEVHGLMGAGVDPHGYEPTPSDIEVIEGADLVGYNGIHLEAMFEDVFNAMEEGGSNIFALEEAFTEEELLQVEEDGNVENDPHIWFAPDLWKKAAELVAAELTAIDPEGEETYQANLEGYLAEIDEMHAYNQGRVEELPEEKRYLITAHDAFNYFGDTYGFTVLGIQGISTQTEAGTSDISDVANLIVENGINAVFVESSVSDRNVEALTEAVEAQGGTLEIGGELYSDSLGTEEEGTGTYIDAYRHNIDTIVDALK